MASYICAFLGFPTDYGVAIMGAALVVAAFRSLLVVRLVRRILYALWLALWDRIDDPHALGTRADGRGSVEGPSGRRGNGADPTRP